MEKKLKVVKVEYYCANWCKICEEFNSEWEKFQNALKHKNINIQTFKYHDEKDKDKINKENIDGYPTILMIYNDGTKKEYMQKRTCDHLLKFVSGKLKIGGIREDYYKKKYLKYKHKYLSLKNKS